MNRYMTVDEIAEILHIARSTARNIIKANLPYIVIGREFRVSEEAFDKYLRSITTKGQ